MTVPNQPNIMNMMIAIPNQKVHSAAVEPFIQLAALTSMVIMPNEPTIGHLLPWGT
jgi:hypothetical protein